MFRDRVDAGRQLAERLQEMGLPDPVVLALPRGGVPVAAEVARRLGAPLDLMLVRKIGAPGHEELAVGAVTEYETVFNPDVLRALGMTEADFTGAVAAKRAEIAARRARYLAGRRAVALDGRTVIVVDDGIATGATMRVALEAVAKAGAVRRVLAVPVAPVDTLAGMAGLVDDVVCLETPEPFIAVGAHYADFRQTTDDEVVRALGQAD